MGQIYWDHPQNDDINLSWIANLEQEMYQYCPPVGWKPEFNAKDIKEHYNPNLVTDYAGVPYKNPAQGTGGGYINYPDVCICTLLKRSGILRICSISSSPSPGLMTETLWGRC